MTVRGTTVSWRMSRPTSTPMAIQQITHTSTTPSSIRMRQVSNGFMHTSYPDPSHPKRPTARTGVRIAVRPGTDAVPGAGAAGPGSSPRRKEACASVPRKLRRVLASPDTCWNPVQRRALGLAGADRTDLADRGDDGELV